MSASADIITQKKEDVMLVPSRAISEDEEGKDMVRVWTEDQVQKRQVTVGLDDGINSEILSGLREGEVVIVETRPKSESDQSLGFF
jgi:multidrug efflux pump subunit AcrA (membrane-fusion protein)